MGLFSSSVVWPAAFILWGSSRQSARTDSGPPSTVVDSVPDVGNTMRFSGSPDNQYISNLSTRRSQLASPPGGDLTAGSYRVTVSNPSNATATADFDTK